MAILFDSTCGYHLWQVAETAAGPLQPEQVELAISVDRRRNTRMVIGAALAAATPKEMGFLRAMAGDEGSPERLTSASG